MTTQVSNPLTLVMDIKSPQDFIELQKLLAGIAAQPPGGNPIDNALTKIGTVHFARFVFLSETQLAVITSYDGDFVAYIQAFTDELGDIFDALLSHISNAPPLPVKDNLKPFLTYIMDNDRSRVNGELAPMFSAYPELTVVDILGLANNKQQAVA